MKIIWQIEKKDVEQFRSFYEAQKKKAFVVNRIERNVKKVLPPFTKDVFWEAMVSCLITTRQRSGPNSPVTSFICTKPFPVDLSTCKESDDVQSTVTEAIAKFGGLRRGNKIGEEAAVNLAWLEKGGWKIVYNIVDSLGRKSTAEEERTSAEIIDDHLKGFGSKQARNLLQSLGLTKYEIPVDSRITKWLTSFGFPVKLSPTALSDKNYYNFVLDGFQAICEACEIYPCAMDAAIFSSFDEDWPEDKLVW